MSIDTIHLTAGGVSVLIDVRGGLLPAVAHWGAALGELDAASARAVVLAGIPPQANNTVDEPVRVALLPEQRTGWLGRPGLSGSRDAAAWSPWFRVTAVDTDAERDSVAMVSRSSAVSPSAITVMRGGRARGSMTTSSIS